MLIEIGNFCVLNTDHIIKFERASIADEKNLILFYHVFNSQINISKMDFEVPEMREAYIERLLKAYENGDKVLRWTV